MDVLLAVILWVVCGIAGAMLNERKGHDAVNGFLLGFAFTVFGLAYVVFRAPKVTPPAQTSS